MTDAAPSRPLRKDAARTRELLVHAAREVFAERGLEASLDDVAHRAGLGIGTAYRHFPNKYELAKAIFAQAVDQIVALAERAAAMDDPWDGIVCFLVGTAHALSSDGGLRELLLGVLDDERVAQVNDRLSGPLRDLVKRAKRSGSLRKDADATDLGIAVMMLCLVADITGDVAPQLWRRYLPMLLDGLRPGSKLPVPPIGEADLRAAMASHKQRLLRVGQHRPE
jgi:AcrR family transcriptional regulator